MLLYAFTMYRYPVNLSEIQAGVLVTVLIVLEQIGFNSFQVTAIQFGTDQLQGAPKEHLSSFIFWYIFVEQIATPSMEWVNYSFYFTKNISQSYMGSVWVVITNCQPSHSHYFD